MKIKIVFAPFDERERAALKLLNIHPLIAATKTDEPGDYVSSGEPEREHRILGALIDILKVSFVP